MDTDDFKQAMRAMSLPTIALLDLLVEKGTLTDQEALIVVDCAESVDPVGPLTSEAIAVLRDQYALMANTLKFKQMKKMSLV